MFIPEGSRGKIELPAEPTKAQKVKGEPARIFFCASFTGRTRRRGGKSAIERYSAGRGRRERREANAVLISQRIGDAARGRGETLKDMTRQHARWAGKKEAVGRPLFLILLR